MALLLGGLASSTPLQVQADPIAEYVAREEQLSKKAAEARSLADEIAVLDENIAAKAAHLAGLAVEAERARRNLAAATDEVESLRTEREEVQAHLNRLVRADYLDGRPNAYFVIASAGSLSAATAATSYLHLFQDKSETLADRLATVERNLSEKREDMTAQVRRLDELEATASRERYEQEALRTDKQRLLAATRGQEDEYRRQSDEARQQLVRMGLFGRAGCAETGNRAWPDLDGYYNQCDSRWAGARLGFSSTSTVGDYGCGVAALASVYRRYGIDTDPIRMNESLKRTRAFVNDLLDWRRTAAASGGRLSLANSPYPQGRGHVNWEFINRQLDSGNPVIVFVERRGEINHYVTLLGREGSTYRMHDSIKGPNLRFQDYYSVEAVVQYITFRRA